MVQCQETIHYRVKKTPEEDEVDDIALESVDAALSAVENEESPEPSAPAPKAAANVIPELEDVEDPRDGSKFFSPWAKNEAEGTTSRVLLQRSTKPSPLTLRAIWLGCNRGVLLEAQQDARGARQSFQICLDLNENHAPATANLAILLERIGDLEGAYETATS